MDWLIFGDDWGAHPSTTQHLIKHLPSTDQIVWINSIGMRSPSLNPADMVRFFEKAKSLLRSRGSHGKRAPIKPQANLRVVNAPVLPWHQNRWARMWNRRALIWALGDSWRRGRQGQTAFHILAANPVAALYLDLFTKTQVAYLRLDDYSNLPGVDSQMAVQAELEMLKHASVVFATARGLLIQDDRVRSIYLPQGVDWTHFAQVSLFPPESKIVGFYGLLAEWIDYDFIRAVATCLPDWRFELVGPVRYRPDGMENFDNLHWLSPVGYEDLPSILTRWKAAWIPFRVDTLTRSVNPLKLREFLAAGLPTLCTPLPEAQALRPSVEIVSTPEQAVDCLLRIHASDGPKQRELRRQSVSGEDWAKRSAVIREVLRSL